jgi:hypothetical protein
MKWLMVVVREGVADVLACFEEAAVDGAEEHQGWDLKQTDLERVGGSDLHG